MNTGIDVKVDGLGITALINVKRVNDDDSSGNLGSAMNRTTKIVTVNKRLPCGLQQQNQNPEVDTGMVQWNVTVGIQERKKEEQCVPKHLIKDIDGNNICPPRNYEVTSECHVTRHKDLSIRMSNFRNVYNYSLVNTDGRLPHAESIRQLVSNIPEMRLPMPEYSDIRVTKCALEPGKRKSDAGSTEDSSVMVVSGRSYRPVYQLGEKKGEKLDKVLLCRALNSYVVGGIQQHWYEDTKDFIDADFFVLCRHNDNEVKDEILKELEILRKEKEMVGLLTEELLLDKVAETYCRLYNGEKTKFLEVINTVIPADNNLKHRLNTKITSLATCIQEGGVGDEIAALVYEISETIHSIAKDRTAKDFPCCCMYATRLYELQQEVMGFLGTSPGNQNPDKGIGDTYEHYDDFKKKKVDSDIQILGEFLRNNWTDISTKEPRIQSLSIIFGRVNIQLMSNVEKLPKEEENELVEIVTNYISCGAPDIAFRPPIMAGKVTISGDDGSLAAYIKNAWQQQGMANLDS